MRLAGARNGVVYCTRGRNIGRWTRDGGFERTGTLPVPDVGLGGLPFVVLHSRLTKRLLAPLVGTFATVTVTPLEEGRLLATAGRWMFVSEDGGRSWTSVHRLPASSGPMGLLPTSVCEHDGEVYLAEYTLGEEDATILVSDDGGWTWSTFLTTATYRHFHGLFTDPYTGELWATTGDDDEESAIGVIREGALDVVGHGSQRWRAVDLAFTPDAVLWGMDSSFESDVELLRLPRSELNTTSPDPLVVGHADCPVFYVDVLSGETDTWAVASTAAEAGIDSRAPPGKRRNTCGRTSRVLASPASSGFERWTEVDSFARRRTVSEYTPWLPTASAYVFQAVCPDAGLLLNPYNTSTQNGRVIAISRRDFEARLRRSRDAFADEDAGRSHTRPAH